MMIVLFLCPMGVRNAHEAATATPIRNGSGFTLSRPAISTAIGAAITAVTQSSSAGVAAALVALDAGAIGFKLNGAGAGGTAMILCKQDCVHLVKNRLQEKFPESEIFPMKLDIGQYQGMQVWETH